MDEVEIFEWIDTMVERWSEILVPIFTDKDFNNGIAFLVGTGFLVQYKNLFFLVTAYHVIQDLEKRQLVIKVSGKAIGFDKMPFFVSSEHDLAITQLDHDWATGNGIERLKALPIEDMKSSYDSVDRYFLMGFPGSKNVLNPRLNKTRISIHGTSFIKKIDSPKSSTHVLDPIAFEFNKSTSVNSDGSKANPPKFNGNSGGPILELVAKHKDTKQFSLSCKLAGVFTGWDKTENEAIAIKPNYLIELIEGALT